MNRRKRIFIWTFCIYVCLFSFIKLISFVSGSFTGIVTPMFIFVGQLYVPALLYRRKAWFLPFIGFHFRNLKESIKLWLGVFFILLIPTILGFHLWKVVYQGKTFHWDNISYRAFSPVLLMEQDPVLPSHSVAIYTKRPFSELSIRWTSGLRGVISSDEKLRIVHGQTYVKKGHQSHHLTFESRDNGKLTVAVVGEEVRLKLWRDERLLKPQDVQYGVGYIKFSSFIFDKNFLFIFYQILLQLCLVAFPEEFFYRGYLLSYFDSIWGVRYFRGIPLSWGNLFVSVLFALSHLLFGFQLYRLGVFFPSLLFGMMRQKTGSLVSSVLFHASANLLIFFLDVFYL